MKQIKTIGDLKQALNDLQDVDDNTELLSKSNNFETGGALKVGIYLSIDKYATRQKQCWDAFDGTPYTTNDYVQDENGETKIKID